MPYNHMEQSLENFIKNCQVVFTAGGEGSRLKSVPGMTGVHKAAFKLPNGQTMIERDIDLYRELGFQNFLLLVHYQAHSLINLLGDGSKLGINITYSHDPERPVGKGGAVKHALKQGLILETSYIIVHNPDDQLVSNGADIIKNAIAAHLAHEKRGAIATALMTEGTPYAFTGFEVKDDFVTSVEMYPFIKMPTHMGMTIFSPAAGVWFDRLINLNKKTDFESVIYPALKNEKKLAAHFIPNESWVSVNDEKGLKSLIKALDLDNPEKLKKTDNSE